MTRTEYAWRKYLQQHPKCNNEACKALFLAGWGASTNFNEEEYIKVEQINRTQQTLF